MRKTWIFNEFVTILFFAMYRSSAALFKHTSFHSYTRRISVNSWKRIFSWTFLFFLFTTFFSICGVRNAHIFVFYLNLNMCFVFFGWFDLVVFRTDRQYSMQKKEEKNVSPKNDSKYKRIELNRAFYSLKPSN